MPSTPRVLGDKDVATTAAGQKLQGDELQKTAKKAAGALLAVAIIMTVMGGVFFMIFQNVPAAARAAGNANLVIGIQFALAAIFWGLWVWARSSPLPAAIVGLVLYLTLVVINVISSVSQMSQAEPGTQGGRGFGGIGIGWLDIVIIAVLVKAIQAGAKYRKMLAEQAPAY
jgi:hypothetical protein